MSEKTIIGCYSKALQYLEMGYSVIPVGADKISRIPWEKYQRERATVEDIEKWFLDNPKNNIAIVTGAISGITVIDLDVHSGADMGRYPSDTYEVKSGNGGTHLYYKYIPEAPNKANVYKGVDIRNDGGYIVAPPSVIVPKYSGEDGVYSVRKSRPLADFPRNLFDFKTKKRTVGERLNLKTGKRNDSIASLAGELLSRYPESKWLSDVWQLITAANATYTPPLPEQELMTTFESIMKLAQTNHQVISPVQFDDTEVIDIKLRRSKAGVPHKDMVNAIMAFEQHPSYAKTIRFNTFRSEIEINGKPLAEEDIFKAQYFLQNDLNLASISKNIVYEALQHHAFKNKYDEALDWLNMIKWDGEKRLDTWLIRSCGLEDTQYHRGIGAQWLLGMVKRLVNPGCVFDHALTIVGPQGVGKTSFFRIIGGEWYKAHTESVDNKDFYLKLRGACLIDLDEGATMFRTDSIKLKSIITETCDEYRAPYDRVTQKYPRRFVFSMSTNDIEPFKDQTGNRRYWIFKVSNKIDFAWLQDNRAQLFAEAYHALINHTELPEVPADEAKRMQEEATDKDEWFNPIMKLVYNKVAYRRGDPDFSVSIEEIYTNALRGEHIHKMDTRTSMRIGNILRNDLKMEKQRLMIDGIRQNRYFLMESEAKRLQEEYDPENDKRFADENW